MLAGSTSEASSLPKLVVTFAATRIRSFGYSGSRQLTRLESQGPSRFVGTCRRPHGCHGPTAYGHMLVLTRHDERLGYSGSTVLSASCCGVSHTAHIITYAGEVIDRTPASLSTPLSFTGDIVSVFSLALSNQSDSGNQVICQ